MKHYLLACLLLCAGCLQPPASHNNQSKASSSGGFTGAVVYGDPNTCRPCYRLINDLNWLVKEYPGWTLGRYETGRYDWTIISDATGYGKTVTPTIEYYRDGKLIGIREGYSETDNPGVRYELLLKIVQEHPAQYDKATNANSSTARPPPDK